MENKMLLALANSPYICAAVLLFGALAGALF
jgi:hypothetical protein